MGTSTSKLGLTKPAYSDTADIADINGNFDAIDGVLGGVAIVINGNKTSYSSGASIGQFVALVNSTIVNSGTTMLSDGIYMAVKTIPYNTAIDKSYLTSVPAGALNSINNRFILATASSFNDLGTGIYYLETGATSNPDNGVWAWLCHSTVSGAYGTQIAFGIGNNTDVYYRTRVTTWGDWQKVIKTTDIGRTLLSTATDFDLLTTTDANKYYQGTNISMHTNIPGMMSNSTTPFALDVERMGSYPIQILRAYTGTGKARIFQRQGYYNSGVTWGPWKLLTPVCGKIQKTVTATQTDFTIDYGVTFDNTPMIQVSIQADNGYTMIPIIRAIGKTQFSMTVAWAAYEANKNIIIHWQATDW